MRFPLPSSGGTLRFSRSRLRGRRSNQASCVSKPDWHIICCIGLNELVARVPHLNGWLVQELPPSREKSARTRRDKIPGDLSCQELASLGSVPIPDVWACMELAMPDLDPPPAHHAAT